MQWFVAQQSTALKKRLGKTLVVFPCHSTDIGSVTSDQELYLKKINSIARRFDTVLVNAFWWNVDDELIHRFESEGYTIVSAGFRDDINFIRRLRTILELADLVVGDSIGTHVGYALALDRPYKFIDVDTSSSVEASSKDAQYYSQTISRQIEMSKLFMDDDFDFDFVKRETDYYWGFSHLKDKESLRQIGEIAIQISKHARFRNNRYMEVACDLVANRLQAGIDFELLREAL